MKRAQNLNEAMLGWGEDEWRKQAAPDAPMKELSRHSDPLGRRQDIVRPDKQTTDFFFRPRVA